MRPLLRLCLALVLLWQLCVEDAVAARPLPPAHGRFAHVAAVTNDQAAASSTATKLQSNEVKVNTSIHRRRVFSHRMIIDTDGVDVTMNRQHQLPTEYSAARQFADDALTPNGFTLLMYDIEMAEAARVIDEDFNVQAVECAMMESDEVGESATMQHTLTLTVNSVDLALSTYTAGSIVHGSIMWGCVIEQTMTSDNSTMMMMAGAVGSPATILIRLLHDATRIDDTTVRLNGVTAYYQELFGEASVLLRQPSLVASKDNELLSDSINPSMSARFQTDHQRSHRRLLDELPSPTSSLLSGRLIEDGLATFDSTCAALPCSTNSSIPTTGVFAAACKLCNQGRQISTKVACTNCDIRYSAQLSVFSFQYSVNPLNLYVRAEARVDALMSASLDLSTHSTLARSVSGMMHVLDSIPIPPSISLPLGVITMTMGLSFALDAGYQIDFTAQASATHARASINDITLSAHALYDTRSTPEGSLDGTIGPVSFTEAPTIALETSGQVALSLTLTPILSVGISHLVSASIQTDLTMDTRVNFSWPTPFSALGSNFDSDPSAPSLIHHGDCSTSHLVRYAVSGGLRNSIVSARMQQDIGSSISGLLSRYDSTRNLGSYSFQDYMRPLLSGCLLPQNVTKPFVITFRVPTTTASPAVAVEINRLTSDPSNFAFNIGADLSSAFNVSMSRFIVNLFDALDHPLSLASLASITGGGVVSSVSVSILADAWDDFAAATSSSASLTPAQLAQLISTQMNDPTSILRGSGSIATRNLILVSDDSDNSHHDGLSSGSIAAIVIVVLLLFGFIVSAALYYALIWRPKHASVQSHKSSAEVIATAVTLPSALTPQLVELHPPPHAAAAPSMTSHSSVMQSVRVENIQLDVAMTPIDVTHANIPIAAGSSPPPIPSRRR